MVTLLDIAYFFAVCIVLCLIVFAVNWWSPHYIIADSDEIRCPGPGLSPARFPEHNYVIRQHEHPARQIPARIELVPGMGHTMTTCWQFTLRDRLKILLTGKLWSSVWVYGEDRHRPYFSVDKQDLLPTSARPATVR